MSENNSYSGDYSDDQLQRGEVVVQGFPYGKELWEKVAEQAHDIGNVLNRHMEGDAGSPFWDAADKIQECIERIKTIHRAQGIDDP